MISQMLIKRKNSLSKDDLDLFMDYKYCSFMPFRKYHSMDANTFYISFPKPTLTRNVAKIKNKIL